MDVLAAVGLGLVTALATGLGVFPVYWARISGRGLGVLWGVSAGVMAAISVLELLAPARSSPVALTAGAVVGVLFVLVASRYVEAWIHGREEGKADNPGHAESGSGHGHGHAVTWSSLSLLIFIVFTIHSGPEGVGIGAALRADLARGLLVVGAIALHNVPEGTAVAVGLRADGQSVWRAFGLAVVTSLPQPILAPIVFLVAVGSFLPAGLGFAGGAMLALVATEVGPEGLGEDAPGYLVGATLGVAIAVGLHLVAPVPGGL